VYRAPFPPDAKERRAAQSKLLNVATCHKQALWPRKCRAIPSDILWSVGTPLLRSFCSAEHELRFSSVNRAGLFAADVMFIYIFTKNELGLTHRDN